MFGDPVLKQRARDVTDIDGELVRIVETMVDTMYDANGLGLAAPQVGIQKRFFTYDVGDGPEALINPEIVDAHGEWVYEEGCLSVPGLHFAGAPATNTFGPVMRFVFGTRHAAPRITRAATRHRREVGARP